MRTDAGNDVAGGGEDGNGRDGDGGDGNGGEGNGGDGNGASVTPDAAVPVEVGRAIAAAVAVDTGRQDVLVEYARALGPDPALTDLDLAALERHVRTGAAEIAAATCRWLGYVAEFVVRGDWAAQGHRTPAAWLSWAVGMAPSTAREHLRVALRLRELPQVRQRFAAGRISYSKVRAITRVATTATEQLLLRWADAAPAHVLERIIADARRLQQTTSDVDEDIVESVTVTRRWRADGTYELILRADAATGLQVDAHLDRLLELDTPDEDAPTTSDTGSEPAPCGGPVVLPQPSRQQREAELLLGALATAVRTAPADTSGADRHTVVLHTTPAELLHAWDLTDTTNTTNTTGTDDDGPDTSRTASAEAPHRRERAASAEAPDATRPVLARDGRGRPRAMSARQLRRWACTAGLTLAVDDDRGHPADLGRTRRLPDARLRRLLQARDRTCRFPACGAGQYLHAHHVVHWTDGGPTDLGNLVLLCGFHHRLVHSDSWRLQPDGPGRWTFHHDQHQQPWARPLPGASAEAALLTAARAHIGDLDPDTAATLLQPHHWHGDYDHDLAIQVLTERLTTAA